METQTSIKWTYCLFPIANYIANHLNFGERREAMYESVWRAMATSTQQSSSRNELLKIDGPDFVDKFNIPSHLLCHANIEEIFSFVFMQTAKHPKFSKIVKFGCKIQ